jgi:hypothetical protein
LSTSSPQKSKASGWQGIPLGPPQAEFFPSFQASFPIFAPHQVISMLQQLRSRTRWKYTVVELFLS